MDFYLAALFSGFILSCLIVYLDWLNYQNRPRDLRIWKGETITGIALDDIAAYVPVVISESSAPGEALFVSQDVFNELKELDPRKVVYLKNLEEGEENDVCQTEGAVINGEDCLYLSNKDNECKGCPMLPPKPKRFYPT